MIFMNTLMRLSTRSSMRLAHVPFPVLVALAPHSLLLTLRSIRRALLQPSRRSGPPPHPTGPMESCLALVMTMTLRLRRLMIMTSPRLSTIGVMMVMIVLSMTWPTQSWTMRDAVSVLEERRMKRRWCRLCRARVPKFAVLVLMRLLATHSRKRMRVLL
eukprot:Rmarinus@m.19310